jgi:hypothetical protein
VAAATLAGSVANAGATNPCGSLPLDAVKVSSALVAIRESLPRGWTIAEIRWETVPFGWTGAADAVLIRVEDGSIGFHHPEEDFTYHPFYKLWLLPTGWEGRMKVSDIDPSSPHALYLGENDRYRVLYRTLGQSSWPEGVDVLAEAIRLDSYPLSHSPKHSLDVGAMQRLYQRFDNAGNLARWQRRIYGIEELPELVYLELLTWEDRTGKRAKDPTFLGDLAELETKYLSREVLATFPSKRALYLRRLTEESFSDVLVVNPNCRTPAP